MIGELWAAMGLPSGRQLFPVQEQSHPMEHRVSLPVQIPRRLHVCSIPARRYWTNLLHDSRDGVLEGRASEILASL